MIEERARDDSLHSELESAAMRDRLLADVQQGLDQQPRMIPSMHLYDEEGSKLFERICTLAEYYPTRVETGLLRGHAEDIAKAIGPAAVLVEPGSGSGDKSRLLLAGLERPRAYVPVEIDREILLLSTERLREELPGLEVLPIHGDFNSIPSLPDFDGEVGRRVVFFPGGTIGNFDRDQAREFLHGVAKRLGAGGQVLVGVDLVKDRTVLERAYDDGEGVTAAFDKNLLVRLNRELNTSFDLKHWQHRSWWNEDLERIEMHLVSQGDQTVRVGNRDFAFADGDFIRTEISTKYRLEGFAELAAQAGLTVADRWLDRREWFSIQLLTVS